MFAYNCGEEAPRHADRSWVMLDEVGVLVPHFTVRPSPQRSEVAMKCVYRGSRHSHGVHGWLGLHHRKGRRTTVGQSGQKLHVCQMVKTYATLVSAHEESLQVQRSMSVRNLSLNEFYGIVLIDQVNFVRRMLTQHTHARASLPK